MLQTYYRKSVDNRCDVFRSKGFAADLALTADHGPAVAMQHLPPFLRTLLVTDGTVTKSLEAFYWEPVAVAGVSQRVTQAEAPIEWLDLSTGRPLLVRHVQLRGQHSGRHFANAFSIIRLDLIPEPLQARLLDGTIGIGELLRSCGLETYRELLELGASGDFSLDGEYPDQPQECVYRTYRITMRGVPAMLVTEYFPVALFGA